MNKLIIEARINEYAGRSQNSHVPWSPEEIADTATQCREAGASVVHFHARTEDGGPEHNVTIYKDIIRLIKAGSDILIHPTLGALANDVDASQRIGPVLELARDPQTRPHFAPLDMGSVNLDTYDSVGKAFRSDESVYINTTRTLKYFAEQLKATAVKPYASLWNVGFTRQLLAFIDMGAIAEPAHVCLILTGDDLPAAHPGTEQGLDAHTMFIPEDRKITWTVMNYGGNLLKLVPKIIAEGGHVSIGLGDWPYIDTIAGIGRPTNAEIISQVSALSRSAGREVSTPKGTAKMLDIQFA